MINVSENNELLKIYHPAAGPNWIASYNLAACLNKPFELRINDIYHYLPSEEHDSVVDSNNNQVFAQENKASDVFFSTQLPFNNLEIFEEMDGKESLHRLDAVDIVYIDWLDYWVDRPANPDHTFEDYAKQFVQKIKNGGYVILDLKHHHKYFPSVNNWYNHPEGVFKINEDTHLEYIGGHFLKHYVDCETPSIHYRKRYKLKIFKVIHSEGFHEMV